MSRTVSRGQTRTATLVGIALALAVLGAACLPPAPPGWVNPSNDIIVRQNNARTGAGLPGFAGDAGMNANAQFHANRLAAASGGACNLWHSSELGAWYAGFSAGENVACVPGCPSDGAAVVNAWLNSPGHRANIMKPGFHYIGAGAACAGGWMFAVTHFRS
jgi:uncharacterized protein YkwD